MNDDEAVGVVVAELGAELRQTRAEIAQLDARLGELDAPASSGAGDTPAHPGGLVAQLRAAVGEIGQRIEQLAEADDISGGGPQYDYRAKDWGALDEQERRELDAALTDWVNHVLIGRYQLPIEDLPGCWHEHRPVIEELTWLYLAWLAAYYDEQARPTAAGEWHERWLPGVLGRIKGKWARGCMKGEHVIRQLSRPPYRVRTISTEGEPAAVPPWQAN